MNLREGTRRLALLLGVVGAIFGGFVSYAELQSMTRQRADHRLFEQLANSDVVKEAKHWRTLAPEQRDKAVALMTPEHKLKLAKALGFNGTPTQSDVGELDEDGIKTIHWDWTLDNQIESIETQDGQTLYQTPAPTAWEYILVALLPVLGFFIPWGAVRAIGWVGAGFVASPK
jgi:hypothetical protein